MDTGRSSEPRGTNGATDEGERANEPIDVSKSPATATATGDRDRRRVRGVDEQHHRGGRGVVGTGWSRWCRTTTDGVVDRDRDRYRCASGAGDDAMRRGRGGDGRGVDGDHPGVRERGLGR